METIDNELCDLCDYHINKISFFKNKIQIIKCLKCGLIRLEKIKHFVFSSVDFYKRTESVDRRSFIELFEFVEKKLSKGLVLDVGCGIGTLLEVGQKRGWGIMGIDFNKKAVDVCIDKNIPVFCVSIEEYSKQCITKYDLIILSETLEHSHSPTTMINACYDLLKDDGYILITTPNINSFLARLLKSRWFHINTYEHLYYFSETTIKLLLMKSNFKNIIIKPYQRYRSLHSIIRTLPIMNLIKPILKLIIPNGMKLYLNDEIIVLAQK